MLALSREYIEFGFDNKTKDHIIDEKFKTALNIFIDAHANNLWIYFAENPINNNNFIGNALRLNYMI